MLKQFLKGSLLLGSTNILVRLSGILVLIPIARLFPPEQFGLYSLVLWTVQYMTAIGRLGIDVAMHRNGAQLYKTQPMETGRLLGVGCLLMTGSFTVIAASLWIWRIPLAELWLRDAAIARWLGFAAITTLTEGIGIVFSVGLLSLHAFKLQSVTLTVGAISKLLLSPLLAWQYGLSGALSGFLIGSTIQAVLSAHSFYKVTRLHQIPLNLHKFGQETWQILHFGFPFYSGNALISLITLPIMGELGRVAGVEALAQIRIGQSFSQLINFLAGAIAPVAVSVLSEAYLHDPKEFQHLRSLHLRSNWLLALSLVTFLSLASHPLTVLLFGQAYSGAVPAVIGMAWISFMIVLTENLNLYTLVAGQTKLIAIGSIMQKVMFVGVIFWLLSSAGILAYIGGHLSGYMIQMIVLSLFLWRGIERSLQSQCYILAGLTLISLCSSYAIYQLVFPIWLTLIVAFLIAALLAAIGLKTVFSSEMLSGKKIIMEKIYRIKHNQH